MITNKIFVYGTLKEVFSNKAAIFLHQNPCFIGEAKVPGKLVKVNWYPGLIYAKKDKEMVYGEIFEMKQPYKILNQLDDYEGIGKNYLEPHEYKREVIPIGLNSKIVSCWTCLYIGNKTAKTISSGVFIK